jgi:hypothetical protein
MQAGKKPGVPPQKTFGGNNRLLNSEGTVTGNSGAVSGGNGTAGSGAGSSGVNTSVVTAGGGGIIGIGANKAVTAG